MIDQLNDVGQWVVTAEQAADLPRGAAVVVRNKPGGRPFDRHAYARIHLGDGLWVGSSINGEPAAHHLNPAYLYRVVHPAPTSGALEDLADVATTEVRGGIGYHGCRPFGTTVVRASRPKEGA